MQKFIHLHRLNIPSIGGYHPHAKPGMRTSKILMAALLMMQPQPLAALKQAAPAAIRRYTIHQVGVV